MLHDNDTFCRLLRINWQTGRKERDMDGKLRTLLDFQCFQSNKRLATLITDVESRYGSALAG